MGRAVTLCRIGPAEIRSSAFHTTKEMQNMPSFALHMEGIAVAEAADLNGKVTEMKRAGREVAALCVGEPDFDTADAVKAAAVRAIDAGKTKYSPLAGIPELQAAICRKFKHHNGLDYRAENIIVSSGGKQVINSALAATLNPGDEVVIAQPFWLGYPDMVRMYRGHPVFVETTVAQDYLIQPEKLEAAISAKTKWVIINSPANPTGAVYQQADLEALAEVLRRHSEVWILSDDIYELIVYDGARFATLAEVAPDLKRRILTMNGCSKGYAMTGWRIGFGAGPESLIRRMVNVQSQVTLGPSTISQWAAVAALSEDGQITGERLRILEARRDLAVSMINQSKGLVCNTPKGAFYIFVDCRETLGKRTPDGTTIASDRDFCEYLLQHAAVAVMPGSAYGRSPYFRLSYVVADRELEAACYRIQEACAALI